jgi:anti-sigma B factor antagonist
VLKVLEGDNMEHTKKLVISSRSKEGVVVFDVDGELSRWAASLPTLSELVKAQVTMGKGRIILNLQNTGFVDSYGVGEIITSFISTQNSGGALKICRIPEKLLMIFKVTGLVKVLTILPTEEAALKAFADSPGPGKPQAKA